MHFVKHILMIVYLIVKKIKKSLQLQRDKRKINRIIMHIFNQDIEFVEEHIKVVLILMKNIGY